MGGAKVYHYKHRASISLGVLQMLTGACAIIFWGVAYKFERMNNLLGYRRLVWKASAGVWCGALFMIFPASLAILSGIRRSKVTIRWHFWITIIFLCTLGPVYLGWSAVAVHTTVNNPAYLCQGAYRDVDCRVNRRLLTMYGLSLTAAILQLIWLAICCLISGQIVCGRKDKEPHETHHNTSAFGPSLQCGNSLSGSRAGTPTGSLNEMSIWFSQQQEQQPQSKSTMGANTTKSSSYYSNNPMMGLSNT